MFVLTQTGPGASRPEGRLAAMFFLQASAPSSIGQPPRWRSDCPRPGPNCIWPRARDQRSGGFEFAWKNSGKDLGVVVWVDAQATIGLSFRSGLGRARHIEPGVLWIQVFLGRGECEIRKVSGDNKSVDMLTKPRFRDTLYRHLDRWRCRPVQSVVNH